MEALKTESSKTEAIKKEAGKTGEVNTKANRVEVKLAAIPENESFARVVVAAFLTKLDPTLEEMSDVKTAVSEAVTNCIIHGYNNEGGEIIIQMEIIKNEFYVSIVDYGKGIADVKKAMEPMFTTLATKERSGMGFVFMEAFMDDLQVDSVVGEGTTIHMKKKIGYEKTAMEVVGDDIQSAVNN